MENHQDETKSMKNRFWNRKSVTRKECASTLQRLSKGDTFS